MTDLTTPQISTPDQTYNELVRRVLVDGAWESGRNGNTKAIFGHMMRFDLRDGALPLLKGKRVAWKTCLKELLWFIRGSTDNRELKGENVHIWDANASREFLDSRGLQHLEEDDLGPVYGHQWRHFNAAYKGRDESYEGVAQWCICYKCRPDWHSQPGGVIYISKESNLNYVQQDVIMNPTTIYGASKLACEKVINYFNINDLVDIRSIRFPGIVSSSTPGGGTTDYIVEMINNIKSKKKYICPISPNTLLPMMHVNDAVDASVKLMSVPRKNININNSYNISSFETTPDEWKNLICEMGYNLEVDFQPDFRQKIADSWPRKIDDKQIRKDLNWKPKFNKIKTLKSVIENYNLT